jgi:signal transduction histidine kinase
MTVANRLRATLTVYVVFLVAIAALYANAERRGASESRALSKTAERVRTATHQLARLDEVSTDAEKYLVTGDDRYRDKFAAAFREFGEYQPRMMQPHVLDSVRLHIQATGDAAQDEMRRRLTESEAAAERATRLAWLVGGAAITLGVILSVLLVRSIVGPLARLAQGTRWVSAGRFDYRLDTRPADEFAALATDFNSMTERLGELDRMKKDFVARVSHDLKTPLSSMQETNNALLDHMAGPLSAKQRRLLELNAESGQRLSAMLGKLLDLSRLEGGRRPTLHMIDVNAIARRSVEAATANAMRRGVRLSIAHSDGSVVFGDPDGISQVVDNLVENAIKFSPADGQVHVAVVPVSDREVALTVADDGPGIPDAERDRVFDRFYQTQNGRGVSGRGVGLGLTICREIVSAHGGRIRVDQNEPRGSVFRVTLRRAATALAGVMLIAVAACAPAQRTSFAAAPADLELRIASLTAEIDAVRCRLDSTTAAADSLRLELHRLKEIDLKPRAPARRLPPK